jgi:hypothetical protein
MVHAGKTPNPLEIFLSIVHQNENAQGLNQLQNNLPTGYPRKKSF